MMVSSHGNNGQANRITIVDVRALFEKELTERGIPFQIDSETGLHAIEIDGWNATISLDNLQRDCAKDEDVGRVSRFVDSIIASATTADSALSVDQLYWTLEPNNYEVPADYRVTISKEVDRVLVHLSSDGSLITWATPAMLETLQISAEEAAAKAFENLAHALTEATIETQDIDGVQLGYLATTLPFKAALILAPNLRETAEPALGWPLLAVLPDRDFLYLWDATQQDLVGRLGPVVVREYTNSSYPISTEVYHVSEQEIRAIGAFPVPE